MIGKDAFIEGLRQAGYRPEDKGDNRLAFVHEITEGRFSGTAVTVGLEVPPDFPVNCPTGPHITPRLIPINTGAMDNTRAAESGPFGSEWQYLSRPFRAQQAGWNRTNRDVKSYLHHVKEILHTL